MNTITLHLTRSELSDLYRIFDVFCKCNRLDYEDTDLVERWKKIMADDYRKNYDKDHLVIFKYQDIELLRTILNFQYNVNSNSRLDREEMVLVGEFREFIRGQDLRNSAKLHSSGTGRNLRATISADGIPF